MDATQDVLEAVFHKKFRSQIFAVRHALGRLCRSIGAVTGQARCKSPPGVAAANSAIEDLARGLACDLAPLPVNAVAPGLFAMPLKAILPDSVNAAFDEWTQAQPVPRMGAPKENADAFLGRMGNDCARARCLKSMAATD